MPDIDWIVGLRVAGVCHFLTLASAYFTPVPRDWSRNLAQLPDVHRRFALAQNAFIGGTIALLGFVSLLLAPDLVGGSACARAWCAATALWWGGRLIVLPWLRVWPELDRPVLRIGFVCLHAECFSFAAAYLWLALRTTV